MQTWNGLVAESQGWGMVRTLVIVHDLVYVTIIKKRLGLMVQSLRGERGWRSKPVAIVVVVAVVVVYAGLQFSLVA